MFYFFVWSPHQCCSSYWLSSAALPCRAQAQGTLTWDKTFPKSDRVEHRKVTFTNRLGISLVADLYVPKGLDRRKRHAALVVGPPYGAVKEQTSGLYAQTLAERGFVTVAHESRHTWARAAASHTASPRRTPSSRTSAPRVDFLGTLAFVDRERIGLLGVCGSGGFGLAAAEIDPRIKAVATVSMYDIGQAKRQGCRRRAWMEGRYAARLSRPSPRSAGQRSTARSGRS